MERRSKVLIRNAAPSAAAPLPASTPARRADRTPTRMPNRTLATLAAAVITCGLASGAMAQATQSPMKGESGERSQPRANAAKSDSGATKGDWTRHFTPEERDAWQQKIAAAADEQERRKLRGQRLAEIQRRTKAQRAESPGGGGQAAARPARQASPEAATAAQRPR